ncbi:hypothetical protein DFH06DRAFT_374743 [Mycena polygramma]|nr:hypothetical protein DFH06DRAFT_374743 [Mycena polygramma]
MGDLEKQEAEPDTLGTEEACAKMWSVYISQAEKYDKALVAGWRADMKGILIFAGLFSSILTAFIIESYRTLGPDPANTTVLILAQISRQLNGSTEMPPIALEFAPPMSAQICNGLWFTALGLSLASAMNATLVEQWSRDYLNKSDMLPSPIERARICSYLYSGLKRFRMHAIVDLIPLLLHMSLLLFFAGLVMFLIPINMPMALIAASILSIVAFAYAVLTVLPLFVANSPCRTPFSGVLWSIGEISTAFWSAWCGGMSRPNNHTMEEVMMRAANAGPTERDKRALCWTLKSLTTEHELEPFVEAIPIVIWSRTPTLTRRIKHDHLLQTLIDDPGVQLGPRIAALLRTCESGLLEDGVRQRRTVLCLEALLAFAMAAKVGTNTLSFPFEFSTFAYLSTTDYRPAQTYIAALRACGIWSLFCSFLGSVDSLIASCEAAIDSKPDHSGTDLLLKQHKVAHFQQEYTCALSLYFPQGSSQTEYWDIPSIWPGAQGLVYIRRIRQRLLDSRESIQLDIFCGFLIDVARSEYEPSNFRETIEILRPRSVSDVAMPQNLGATFRTIVERLKNDAHVNHVDRAIAVYLPLFDFVDTESQDCATDALIMYINSRAHSDAILHVLQDCKIEQLWVRMTRRLTRSDEPDDVLKAFWRLCDLLLDHRFHPLLQSIPLRRFVETASKLPPVSQYTGSVEALLRTAALHAVQMIHIPIGNFGMNAASLAELQYASNSAWLCATATAGKDVQMLRTDAFPDPEAVPHLDIDELHERLSHARLDLMTQYITTCTSPPLPYNAMHTLIHIGSAPAPNPSAPQLPVLQTRFSEQLWTLVTQPVGERLLQTILQCPLVSGLQWVDIPAAHAMRTALNKAWVLGQQLPVVWDTLGKLPPAEDEDRVLHGRVPFLSK